MNLRISNGQLRFRITRAEMEALLQGTPLELELPLAHQSLRYSIRTDNIASSLSLEEQAGGLHLVVDKVEFETLARKLPSREGIERRITLGGKELLLALEVDVRRVR